MDNFKYSLTWKRFIGFQSLSYDAGDVCDDIHMRCTTHLAFRLSSTLITIFRCSISSSILKQTKL